VSSTDDGADAGAAPDAHIVVVGGGLPSAQELAALTVALTPGPATLDAAPSEAAVGSAWRRASRLEGVGFRAFVSVDDVDAYHRSLA
jgi:hypothetical protein